MGTFGLLYRAISTVDIFYASSLWMVSNSNISSVSAEKLP